MKILQILLFVGFLFAFGQSQTSFSVPGNCEPDQCTYHCNWRVIGESVEFSVNAKVTGTQWAGVGFSENGQMVGSDAVVGWYSSDGIARLTDRYLKAKNPSSVPIDDEENIAMTAFSRENDRLKYSFVRGITSTDKQYDWDLTACVYLIFAWGGNGLPDGGITKHADKARTSEPICFQSIPQEPSLQETIEQMVPEEERMKPMEFSDSVPSESSMQGGKPPMMPDEEGIEPVEIPYPVPLEPSMQGAKAPMMPDEEGMKPVEIPDDQSAKTVSRLPTARDPRIQTSCDRKLCQVNSFCMVDRGIARCYCKPDYPMNRFGVCRKDSIRLPNRRKPATAANERPDDGAKPMFKPEPLIPDDNRRASGNNEGMMDKCKNVKCTDYAVCHKDTGHCKCIGGYHMEDDKCREDMVKPPMSIRPRPRPRPGDSSTASGQSTSMIDKCKYVKCTDYAVCHEDTGHCKCIAGYHMKDDKCKEDMVRPHLPIRPDPRTRPGDSSIASGQSTGMIDKCKNVKCTDYAVCHKDIGHCKCIAGYHMKDDKCKKDMVRPPLPIGPRPRPRQGHSSGASGHQNMDKCRNVRCSKYAKCNKMTGRCRCMSGYQFRDGVCKNMAKPKPIVPGPRPRATGDSSRASGHNIGMIDKCKNVRCTDYAVCHKGTGHCKCMKGYHMDNKKCKKDFKKPMHKPKPIVPNESRRASSHQDLDKCKNVKCSEYAECNKMTGYCRCMSGYHFRDGGCKSIKPIIRDKCYGVICSAHSHCNPGTGYCSCKPGYTLSHSGQGGCKQISSMNRCGGHMCPLYSMCHAGKCRCKTGYMMSHTKKCVARHSHFGLCRRECHPYSHCNEVGKCQCNEGYMEHSGKCVHNKRMCMGQLCHENAYCDVYKRRCQCNDGYMEYIGTCKEISMSKRSCYKRCWQHGDLEIGKCSCHKDCMIYGVCCDDFHDLCIKPHYW